MSSAIIAVRDLAVLIFCGLLVLAILVVQVVFGAAMVVGSLVFVAGILVLEWVADMRRGVVRMVRGLWT